MEYHSYTVFWSRPTGKVVDVKRLSIHDMESQNSPQPFIRSTLQTTIENVVETGKSDVGRGKESPSRSDGQVIRQSTKGGFKGTKGTEIVNAVNTANDFSYDKKEKKEKGCKL